MAWRDCREVHIHILSEARLAYKLHSYICSISQYIYIYKSCGPWRLRPHSASSRMQRLEGWTNDQTPNCQSWRGPGGMRKPINIINQIHHHTSVPHECTFKNQVYTLHDKLIDQGFTHYCQMQPNKRLKPSQHI